ncbi:MAG TPA: hypothetical protein VEJ87_08060 [Acidimicrobiales bacterium]|nr:hypothetical protein [Acidimicrobiales bacterium]
MNRKGEGWLVFATVVLGLSGLMRIFDAIWAFSYHGALPDGLQGAIFGHSLKTYGWIYIVEAIILIGAAAGIVAGSPFARWVGIVAGALACLSAIWLMPYYPVWSFTYIVLGALVIYSLAAYGGEPVTEH